MLCVKCDPQIMCIYIIRGIFYNFVILLLVKEQCVFVFKAKDLYYKYEDNMVNEIQKLF